MYLEARAKLRSKIQGRAYLIVTLLSTYAFHSTAVAIDCEAWFEKLNLKRGSVECVAACKKAGDQTADANKENYCSPYCRGMCVPDKDEVKGNEYRKGEFVEHDGKTSAEEDFANNVEYFLFDQAALKNKSPNIFSWIQKNLGQKLRLGKGCLNGK